MNYSDFLSLIGNGCNLIFTNLGVFVNSLLSNYIFITLIGISLFISLVRFLYYKIINAPSYLNQDLDDTKHAYFGFTKSLDEWLERYKRKGAK